jgi:hypothetical protein
MTLGAAQRRARASGDSLRMLGTSGSSSTLSTATLSLKDGD